MKNRTYRYAENNVLFPFGLNYSEVICTEIEYSSGIAEVKAENSENAVPNVSLCGFKQIKLIAGKSLSVKIPVLEKAFAAVDENVTGKRFDSRFTLYAGTHQPDPLSDEL